MALVFLALSCEGSGGDGCGDCNTDALITGCTGGCGTGCKPIGDGCIGSCLFGGEGDGCGCGAGEGCDLGLDGCLDCGDVPPYAYPASGHVAEQAIQVHVTGSLFSFVNERLIDIIRVAVGDMLEIGADGTLTYCLDRDMNIEVGTLCTGGFDCKTSGHTGANNGCKVDIKIRSVVLRPAGNNKLFVDVRIQGLNARMHTSSISGCNRIALTKGSNDITASIGTTFILNSNAATPHTEFYLAGNDVALNIDSLNIDLAYDGSNWSGGNIGCTIGGGIVNGIINGLKGTLVSQITDGIGALTCRGCSSAADCGAGANCSNGFCQYPGGTPTSMCQGIQMGVDASVDVGAVLASIAPGAEGKLGARAFLGNYAETIVGGGIQLGGRLGVTALENSLCVPYRPVPIQAGSDSCRNGVTCPKIQALNAIEGTVNGEQFHIGLGVAMSGLNLALWSVYNSGLLCLSLDATALMPDLIHTELLATFASSIRDVTEAQKQPLILQLRPEQAPKVEFDFHPENGAVINVILQDLHADLYTFVHERHSRIATITINLEIPLGIMASGSQLQIALGDLGALLGPHSLTVTNGELVDQAQLSNLISNMLPGLIGGLAGDLESLIPPIDIPDIQGIQLRFVGPGITLLPDTNASSPGALGLFIRMDVAAIGGARGHVEPVLQDVNIDIQDPVRLRDSLTRRIRAGEVVSYQDYMPKVQVRMDAVGEGVANSEAEYAYSINNGPWSFWKSGPVITIDNPVLSLEREHEIRIRARAKGDASTGSNVFEYVTLVNDFTRPAVALEAEGGRVRVVASDNVYAAGQLTMSYNVNGGSFTAAAPINDIDLTPYLLAGEASVEVHVFDPSGNVTAARRVFGVTPVDKSAGQAPAAADDVDGCASAQGNSGLLALFGLVALLLFRRRRQVEGRAVAAANPYMTIAMLFVMALGLSAAGCKSKNPPIGDCGGKCASWQSCNDGVCEASACTEDEDCGSAGRCENGFCRPATSCIDNFDCEVLGEVCIDGYCEPSQCEDTSDCTISCSNGQLPYCDYDPDNMGGACVCSDPLAIGNHGKYLNVVAKADGSAAWALTYSSDYGDAMVSRIGDDGSFNWDFFDGVPANAWVAGPPSGPRGGIRDAGPLAGTYIGAALEEGENGDVLHVAYQWAASRTATEFTLRYARGVINGDAITWTKFDLGMIDSGVAHDGRAGLYNRVVIDSERGGVAVISTNHRVRVQPEVAEEDPAAPTEYYSEVRYYYAATTAPESAEDFTIATVVDQQEDPRPCAATCGLREVCAAETNTCVPNSTNAACEECGAGEVCGTVDGAPACFAGDPGQEGIAYVSSGTGLYTSAIIVGEKLHLSYYDRSYGNLKYTVVDVVTGIADSSVILDGERMEGAQAVDTGDIGWWTQIVEAPNGQIIVFYQDGSRGSLNAAIPAQSRIYLVDRGLYYDSVDGRWVELNFVGASPQVVVGEAGLEIYYADATNHVVRKAVWENLGAAPAAITNAPIAWGNTNSSADVKANTEAAISFYSNVVRTGNLEIFASLGLVNKGGMKTAVYATVNRSAVDPGDEDGDDGDDGEEP